MESYIMQLRSADEGHTEGVPGVHVAQVNGGAEGAGVTI